MEPLPPLMPPYQLSGGVMATTELCPSERHEYEELLIILCNIGYDHTDRHLFDRFSVLEAKRIRSWGD